MPEKGEVQSKGLGAAVAVEDNHANHSVIATAEKGKSINTGNA